MYINDLLEDIESHGLLFADDAKIFKHISSREDSVALQADINSVGSWSKTWLLTFHPDKCHVLTIGKFTNIRHTHRYKVYGKELEHVFAEKDLGVVIDGDLNFEEHMSEKINKANAVMGMIRRTFSFLDCHLFKKLYTTFVRPHLEYAHPVWSPHLLKYISIIENVQKRATKLVDGLHNYSYSGRLRKLDLPTLLYRRERGDMIEVYKHFHTYDKISISSSFRPQNRPSGTHDFQLHTLLPKDGTRGVQSNSFYYRVANTWNNLPKDVVTAPSINIFKNKLDDHWKELPIKFNHKPTTIDS